MLSRGWTDSEVEGLLGGNILRILDGADRVRAEMATMPPSAAVLDARTDLPCDWGGEGGAYLASGVRDYLAKKGGGHDEL